MNIEFTDLGAKSSNNKVLLGGISGGFIAGNLNAVMGPSGAGKTTFINVLCGRCPASWKITGTVKANEQEMDLRHLKKIVGFVPQDDIVHEDLTVK